MGLGLRSSDHGGETLGDGALLGGGFLGGFLLLGQTGGLLLGQRLSFGGFLLGEFLGLHGSGSGAHGFEFQQGLRLGGSGSLFLGDACSLLGLDGSQACGFLLCQSLGLGGLTGGDVGGNLGLHGGGERRGEIDHLLAELSGGGGESGGGFVEHAGLDFKRLKFLRGVSKKGEEFGIELGGHYGGRKWGGDQ